jgi:hypothetical protein
VCVGQEIEFARRVPGTETLIEGARLKLAQRWWEWQPWPDPQTTGRLAGPFVSRK